MIFSTLFGTKIRKLSYMVKGMKFATVWFMYLRIDKALLCKLGRLMARNDAVPLPKPTEVQSISSFRLQFLPA
jgi:hypothetical protein